MLVPAKENTMRGLIFYPAILVSMMVVITLSCIVLSPIGSATEQDATSPTIFIGKIGPDAIALDAQMVRLPKKNSDQGEPVALKLKVAKEAYATILYHSSKGDVTVLLPNVETPNNLLKPEKEYTFFGLDSNIRLTLGTKRANTKIICYVSTKPIKLSLSKLPTGHVFLTIPRTSTGEMDDLKKQIAEVAATKGFNRRVLSMEGPEAANVDLKMMGIPKAIKSKKPGTVTGVQGLKEDVEKMEKK
jgi:hypothetical protein